MTLANRRRALMAMQKTVDTSILWSTENQAFNGGNLDTGIKLCESDIDFSVAYDVTLDTNPTSGNGSKMRLLRIINEAGDTYSLSVHKATGTSSEFAFRWMGTVHGIGTPGTGRHRFVISHSAGSGSATMKYRKGTGTAETQTLSDTFTASSKNLVFGQSSGDNQLPKGTWNKVVIYNRVLSATEINAFLGLT